MSNVTVVSRKQLDSIRKKARVGFETLIYSGRTCVTVVYERIFQVEPAEIDDTEAQRRELHEMSLKRASKWPNTFQAQRARKERARQERLQALEEERVKMDEQEAELQREKRTKILQRANKQLFDESDRVKALHSKMLLSEVMKERASQVLEKQSINSLKQQQTKEFHEQLMHSLELKEEAELQKMAERRQRAVKQRDDQMAQLEHMKQKILAERAQDRKEGLLLKVKAEEEAEDMKRKERESRELRIKANEQTKRANEQLKYFKLKELEREKLAEEAIQRYAQKKAQETIDRENRLAEKQAAKEEKRRIMCEIMERNFMDVQHQNEARLARDVQAAEDKAAQKEVERLRQLKEDMEAIDRSRKQQLQLKKERVMREKAMDKEFSDAWQERTRELRCEEEAEMQNKRYDNVRNLDYIKMQIDQKRERKQQQRFSDLQDAAMIESNLFEDDHIFSEYADACINEWDRKQMTTKPMTIHLSKKPSVITMT